jgi:hypothetical protein
VLRIDGIAVQRKNSPQREQEGKHGRMLLSYSKNGAVGNHVLEEFGLDHKGHKELQGKFFVFLVSLVVPMLRHLLT